MEQYTVHYRGNDVFRCTRVYKVKSTEQLFSEITKEIAALERITIEQVIPSDIFWNQQVTCSL